MIENMSPSKSWLSRNYCLFAVPNLDTFSRILSFTQPKSSFDLSKGRPSLAHVKNPIPQPPQPFIFVFTSPHTQSPQQQQVSCFLCQATISNMSTLVEVKVNVHCDECIKKILKAIKKIEDIETYDVDTQMNKVTVTGNVTTEEVIRVLQKIGKQASPWEGDENKNLNYG